MKFNRRGFVKTGIAGAVSGLLVSTEVFAGEGSATNLARLGQEDFRALIGSTFVLSGPRSAHTATLAELVDFRAASKSGECFGLVFETSETRIEEGIFNVFSQSTGNLELFFSVESKGRRSAMVATINRL